ncbi:MAG TPA: histidine kinase [Anaerolineaceae bacterium]|nr:histidine kinase [Anaerolineaceae bacterium]
MINPTFELDWYRDVVEFAPDTFNVIDRDGVMLYTNSRSITEVPEDFLGTPIYDYFLPEFFSLVKEKIRTVFETGKNDHYELATDYSGTRTYYMTNLAPIKRDGEIVAVAMYIRNITELKNTQNELSSLNDELENRVQKRTLELREYAKRMEETEKLSIALRKAESHTEVIDLLVEQFKISFCADVIGIYEVEDSNLTLTVNLSPELKAPQRLSSFSDKFFFSLLSENQIRIAQIPEHKHENCQFCDFIHEHHMHTLVLAPIRAASEMVGVLYMAFKQPKQFSMDDEQLMRSFVEAGGNTLHRIQLMVTLENNIANRENELSVLYNIMAIASETVDLDELLKNLLEKILIAVDCGIGVIQLVENGNIVKSIQLPDELPDAYQQEIKKVDYVSNNIQKFCINEKYYFTKSDTSDLNFLCAGIRSKGMVLGTISLIGECLSDKDREMIHLIISIADEIGLAVESTRHRKRAEETLILEERQRLARDLHDSVSQSLYGLVLAADISKKLLKLKEFNTLEDTLKDIETFSLQSLREMRLMLFELRPLSFESEGLSGALELRLNTVERRAGLNTSLDIIGDELLTSPIDLEIYRIATEALNNALKHSNASQIHVSLHVDKEYNQCELKVIDNGMGFEPDTNRMGGIGLNSMRERAARVGGQLIVESKDNFGTVVRFLCPLNREQGSKQ